VTSTPTSRRCGAPWCATRTTAPPPTAPISTKRQLRYARISQRRSRQSFQRNARAAAYAGKAQEQLGLFRLNALRYLIKPDPALSQTAERQMNELNQHLAQARDGATGERRALVE